MAKPYRTTILEAARALITNPDNWCRGSFARASGGTPVAVDDPRARRFCAVGALVYAAFQTTGDMHRAEALASHIARTISPTNSLVYINDTVGLAAVMSLFNTAIAEA